MGLSFSFSVLAIRIPVIPSQLRARKMYFFDTKIFVPISSSVSSVLGFVIIIVIGGQPSTRPFESSLVSQIISKHSIRLQKTAVYLKVLSVSLRSDLFD